VAGGEKAINAYATVKDNTDSGQFRAIQKAGVHALNHLEQTKAICNKYSRRFDFLVKALQEAGFDAHKPKGSFYCYVPCPKGTKSGATFQSAEEASEYLIREALISTVPWDDAGAFLRFSVTFEADGVEEEKQVVEEMKQRLLRLGLVFFEE
jgi:LL-diaminopimelate aminotransferase